MKKAVIITPFDSYSYNVRIRFIEKYLAEKRYDVRVISSDFDHRNKTTYSAERKNLELLHVPPYKKNFSYGRINSHRVFAKRVLSRLCELSPDLIYCSAPPNYLFKYTSQYKKKNPTVKLIYELGDLWPETLPLQGMIKKLIAPVLSIWAHVRDNNIKFADGVIYECQMFKDVVSRAHPGVPSEVIYLSKDDYYKGFFELKSASSDIMRLAYVGSINNIIDIDLIVEILSLINEKRKTELVIIGGGESAKHLLNLCDYAGIKYENHGIIYDEEKKHKILCTCQFGLNIMKDSVAVGATMKSLEYFHEGLILINNISADTEKIVQKYKCGVNIKRQSIKTAIDIITDLNDKQIDQIRNRSRKAYTELFEAETMKRQFLSFLSLIENK